MLNRSLKKPNEEAKTGDDSKSDDMKKPDAKKAKKLTKSTDLTVNPIQAGPSQEQLNNLISIEKELQFHARIEKERADAKNSLEEYIYEMRDKLCGDLSNFIEETQKNDFSTQLEGAEDWLYTDGDSQEKQVYIDKLDVLKVRCPLYFIY